MEASIWKALTALKTLKRGATVYKLMAELECSHRSAVRWLEAIDRVEGVERIPGPVGKPWTYRIRSGR
jgi:hypothetical protein